MIAARGGHRAAAKVANPNLEVTLQSLPRRHASRIMLLRLTRERSATRRNDTPRNGQSQKATA